MKCINVLFDLNMNEAVFVPIVIVWPLDLRCAHKNDYDALRDFTKCFVVKVKACIYSILITPLP